MLEGDFCEFKRLERPHIEDMRHRKLRFVGSCSSDEFRRLLSNCAFPSVEEAFEVTLPDRQKHIPTSTPPPRSLATVQLPPTAIQIVPHLYDDSKIKLNLTEPTGKEYRFLGITDLGFHDYAKRHRETSSDFAELNRHISRQSELFVRLGLSRPHKAPDGREGFWIQVNGIYTFPDSFEGTRRYA
jgi:hypothetical protein